MVELFSNFTTTLVVISVILALGIIFEKQLIALEDKFDAYVLSLRKTSAKQTATTVKNRNTATKKNISSQKGKNGYAA